MVDFSNIDLKAEFRRSQQQIDLKVTDAYANVLIVLSQNKNHLFNMECSLDQESEFILNVKREPVSFEKHFHLI